MMSFEANSKRRPSWGWGKGQIRGWYHMKAMISGASKERDGSQLIDVKKKELMMSSQKCARGKQLMGLNDKVTRTYLYHILLDMISKMEKTMICLGCWNGTHCIHGTVGRIVEGFAASSAAQHASTWQTHLSGKGTEFQCWLQEAP